MRVIPPLEIDGARLTSSTVSEPASGVETAWTSGATFNLRDQAILGAPSATVTMTVATPAVLTWNAHGLPNGSKIVLTTTGALPTGFTAGVAYYMVNRTTNTFQLAEAADGFPIATTGTQSGTHTATASIHRIYESQIASNTGNPPAIDDGTKWLDIGPTNKFAMFDLYRSTATFGASPLTVVITPGVRVDAIAMLGLVADTAQVTITSSSTTVYDETIDLNTREVLDWYDYFFEPFSTAPSFAKLDLPPYTNAIITVTLTRSSGYVSCGALCLGSATNIGATIYTAQNRATNYSRITRDEFGEATLTPRRSVPKVNATVICDKGRVNVARDLRTALNAVPAAWIGVDDSADGFFEAMLILGIYKIFDITIDQPTAATIALELEEI